jgi:hypothetical protein
MGKYTHRVSWNPRNDKYRGEVLDNTASEWLPCGEERTTHEDALLDCMVHSRPHPCEVYPTPREAGMLSVAQFKELLPLVDVEMPDGTRTRASVKGRELPFALLEFEYEGLYTWRCSWEAVTRAYNLCEAIKVLD